MPVQGDGRARELGMHQMQSHWYRSSGGGVLCCWQGRLVLHVQGKGKGVQTPVLKLKNKKTKS